MILKLKKNDEPQEAPQESVPVSSVSPVDNNEELPAGTELHGYSILRKLGSGGMGTVYLAEQKSMRRQIALKILNPSVTKDASSVEQFLNEVRNTGQIHHPNIVNAFDAGCENGMYFLAMQYIKGDTLDHILQVDGAMNEIQSLEIAAQIAGALSHVWNKYKMFHRDIKPGNIMLDKEENKAMLMDLGIAQTLGDSNENEESVEGSPFYMSPEQIQGKKLSWTTDLYSLGATLYQLIVGVPPYDDKTIEDILKMHCQADFPVPAERNPGCTISNETVELLQKMMNKAPNKRFASWEAFIAELERVIALLKDLEAHPEKRTAMGALALAESKRRKQQQKKRKNAIITLVIFLLIAVAAALGYWYIVSKNSAAAQLYLDDGNGTKGSKLQEDFEKFKADPSTYENFTKVLKQAEIVSQSLGVAEENTRKILAQVNCFRNESAEIYDSYEAFKKYMTDFENRRKRINEQQSMLDGKVPTRAECKYVSDLIDNLESVTNAQKPILPVHINQLNKFKAAIVVMKRKAQQNYAKLEQAERAKAEAVARRSKASVGTTAAAGTFDFSEVDSSVQSQVNAAEKKKKAEADARQKAENDKLKKAKDKFNKSSGGAVKPVKVQMPNGADALAEIKKDTAKLKKLFFDAIYLADLEAADNIKLNPVYDQLPQTPEIKKELAKLKAEYNKHHAPVAKAYEVWKELNDLNNLGHFQQMTVRATDLNRSLRKATLTIAKIADGKVYFLDAGSTPVPFVNLYNSDKNDIVRKLFSVKKFDKDAAYNFCYLLGIFEVAYEIAPRELRNKVINEAKTMVRELYKEARKRNDYATMRRLERDYKGLKIMKGIFR